MEEKKTSWWATVPGILTGIAGLITATGGLLLILYEINVIGPEKKGETTDEKQKTEESSKEIGKDEEKQPEENDQEKYIKGQIHEINSQIERLYSEIDVLNPGAARENPDAIKKLVVSSTEGQTPVGQTPEREQPGIEPPGRKPDPQKPNTFIKKPYSKPHILILFIVVILILGLGFIILTIYITFKIQRRKVWQKKAKEKEPPDTCQPCTRYCRKIELELKPALRKIIHLALSSCYIVSGEERKVKVKGEVVNSLNKMVMAHRRREKPEILQDQAVFITHALLQQIMKWLHGEQDPHVLSFAIHLKGGKVKCQFILYHCKRRGTVNVWEEEGKWKATIKDEIDEPLGTLRGFDPSKSEIPERLVTELTRLLMQFIEKV